MQTALLDHLHLIACTHDSHDEAGRQVLEELVRRIDALVEPTVHQAAVAGGDATLARFAKELPTDRPGIVIPLLLSTGYDMEFELRRISGRFWERSEKEGGRNELHVCASLGPSVRIARIQARRLQEAGWRPGDAVVMGATGVSAADGLAAAEQQRTYLQSLLGVPVGLGYGSSTASPSIEEAVEAARRDGAERVAVVSYLLAAGPLQDRLAQAGADLLTAPLLQEEHPQDGAVIAELAVSRAVDYARKFLPAAVG